MNTSGQVVERYLYDPYGSVTVTDANWVPRTGNAGAYDWRYLFQGGRLDTATGWYDFRNRDLIPSEGRWAERDPLGLAAGDPNEYRFVGNDPAGSTDPSGLYSWAEYWAEYWGGVGEVFQGYGDAAVGTAKGAWSVVRHPIQTAQGVATAVAHPIRTGQAIAGAIREKSGTLRGQGEIAGDVLIGVASGGVVVKVASKSATVAKISSKLKNLRKLKKPKETCPAPKALPPLRQAYIQEVEALKDAAAQMSAAGKTPEEIARILHQMRRDISTKYKELTPPEMLEQIYQRNLEKYGDKLGPTIEYLRGKGKTWEEIIESASRTGGADLGLAKPQQ